MILDTQVFVEVSLELSLNHNQNILLVGNVAECGSWRLDNAKYLEGSSENPHLYKTSLQLPVGTSFEYKYVVVEEKGEKMKVFSRWLPEYDNRIREITEPVTYIKDKFHSPDKKFSSHLGNTLKLQIFFSHRSPLIKSNTSINGLVIFKKENIIPEYDFEVESANSESDAEVVIEKQPKSHDVALFAKNRNDLDLYINFYDQEKAWVGKCAVLASEFLQSNYGDICVPVLGAKMNIIGKLTFHFLLITPWAHPANHLQSIAKPSWRPEVDFIGHRGFGKTGKTFIIENTLLSFNTAYRYGLRFVEFDVHVTSDNVPVIYHDFLIPSSFNEKGAIEYLDISTLSYEKFKSISPMLANGIQNFRSIRTNYSFSRYFVQPDQQQQQQPPQLSHRQQFQQVTTTKSAAALSPLLRSNNTNSNTTTNNTSSSSSTATGSSSNASSTSSNNSADSSGSAGEKTEGKQGKEKRSARTKKEKRHSSYLRKNDDVTAIETWKLTDNFHPSLEELFKLLPEDLGFNVEIKYPDRPELLNTCFSRERNEFVDSVLKVIFDHGRSREIYISSFDPEICMLCKQKQTKYHVFFLVESRLGDKRGGRIEYDSRCSSLKSALEFGIAMNFRGIVCRADPLLYQEETREVIKELNAHGKLLFTYGPDNSDPDRVALQKAIGVHGIITDNFTHFVNVSPANAAKATTASVC